jgi:hypothetical protein
MGVTAGSHAMRGRSAAAAFRSAQHGAVGARLPGRCVHAASMQAVPNGWYSAIAAAAAPHTMLLAPATTTWPPPRQRLRPCIAAAGVAAGTVGGQQQQQEPGAHTRQRMPVTVISGFLGERAVLCKGGHNAVAAAAAAAAAA